MAGAASSAGWFERFLLPGLVFKAVVIGGGYATGRELAEFFLGSGPQGGLAGLVLAMAIWSAVCALTFLFARTMAAYDYRSFFGALLGPFWVAFDIIYILFLILILAVVAAAAGAIGAALFGWPSGIGTALLMVAIIGTTALGTQAAERLFRYSSVLIYLVYAIFVLLVLARFGGQTGAALEADLGGGGVWIPGAVSYASYNIIGALAVLPFLRHLTSRRDAVIAGLAAGPLAMLPAILFFLCMIAFHPEIAGAELPSDFILRRLDAPWLHVLFQAMIFCALLETGIGIVNSINERIEPQLPARHKLGAVLWRLGISTLLVVGSGSLAARFGLVELIARGYGLFGYVMFAIFILPLVTYGFFRILKSGRSLQPSPMPDVAH